MSDQILNNWLSNKPESFGGIFRSYKKYGDKKIVNESFKKNDVYTRFKQIRRAKYFNPVYVYRKREQFQADIVFYQECYDAPFLR